MYAGAHVIEIAPIAEASANNYDARDQAALKQMCKYEAPAGD